ncbi:P-selectin glycoprotein ligand 1 isoform X2 [Ochotona curzoniae]|nr:P-selectin glycoprotein ligand 1 isoform X2 [Ochotona curzoniae]XP_040859372.1 P-selectin glycoprotein ligand 1 isoform X2 [Ochotona curzoniae]XP_040859373.1 P-selectin glycoprotein ligand 1 isoform X2 [Ochotona curzoniae]
MPLRLLLLFTLLGPSCSLQLWDYWEDGAKEVLGPGLARERRQVYSYEAGDYEYPDVGTDPPEIRTNSIMAASSLFKLLTTTAIPGTSESATVEATTRDSAGLDAGGTARENLSTELTTQRVSVTVGLLPTQLASTTVPETQAVSTEEPLSTEPATMESVRQMAMEAETTEPTATEVDTMEVTTTLPAATEVETTEVETTKAATTPPTATEAPPMESTVVEVLSTEPEVTTDSPAVELTTPITHTHTLTAASSDSGIMDMKRRKEPPSESPGSPSPSGTPDHIPVRQCLLAILILALVATVFLVCSVVLAIRLTRKNHMYPVRGYSPTEMVCISSLLPEGTDGATTTTNGLLPKELDPKAEAAEERKEDTRPLHSFLP